MIAQANRVQIWASQLEANQFPPVCAMTGQPAQTWRKFTFSTPPPWVYALLVLVLVGGLGILLYAVVVNLVSQKATGYLPLTFGARNRLRWYLGIVVALLPLSFVAFFVGLAFASSNDSTSDTTGGILVVVGLILFILFLVGALFRRYFGPGARVSEPPIGHTDRMVELQRVHPAFVAAVLPMRTPGR